MNIKKLLGWVGLPILVICHTSNAYAQSDDPSLFCLKGLPDMEALSPLKGKLDLFSAQTQTIAMLNNNSRPNKVEKEALTRWDAEITNCFNEGRVYRKRFLTQKQITILEAASLDTKNLIADLYSGKFTYGTFAKTRAAHSISFISAIASANQEAINSAADAQQRQQLIDQQNSLIEQQAAQAQAQNALANRALNAQIIQSINNNRPVYNSTLPAPAPPVLQQPNLQSPTVQWQPLQPYQPTNTPNNSYRQTNCVPNGSGGVRCTSY